MELRVKPSDRFDKQVLVARLAADLTQVELAARLNVSPRTVQNWEANVGTPRAKHRRAFAEFLRSLDGVAA